MNWVMAESIELSPSRVGFCLAVVLIVAVLHGYTGSGFALIVSPLLPLVVEPSTIITIDLLLGIVASLLLLLVWKWIACQTIRVLLHAAWFGSPFGIYALDVLPSLGRHFAIAAVVLLTTALLALGIRIRTLPGCSATVRIGRLSRLLNGTAGLNGSPYVLFFLSSPAGLSVKFASLVLSFAAADLVTAGFAAAADLINASILLLSVTLAPFSLLGQWVGGHRFNENKRVISNHVPLALMMAASPVAASWA